MNNTAVTQAKRGRGQGGFSLVEVVVALGVMSMLMLSIAQLFLLSNQVSRHVQEVTRLTGIAEYQMEELRRRYLNSAFVPPELENNASTAKPADFKTMTQDEFRTLLETRHAFLMMWDEQAETTEGTGTLYRARPVYYDPADSASVAIVNDVVDNYGKGKPLMAWVYWWVRPSGFTGMLEVQLHVDSGYRNLLGAPDYPSPLFLGNASVRQTIYLTNSDFYD